MKPSVSSMRWSATFRTHFDGRELLILFPHQLDEGIALLGVRPDLGVAIEGMLLPSIPEKLADRVPSLRSLSVLHMISPAASTSLYGFRELEGLEARLRDLDNPPEIVRLPKLRSVALPWSELLGQHLKAASGQIEELGLIDYKPATQNLAPLSCLSVLQSLEVLYGSITSLTGIESMTSLRKLELCGVPELADFSALSARASTLQILSLNNIPAPKGLFDVIAKLPELRVLKLIQQPPLASLDFVSQLPHLAEICLVGTRVSRKQREWLRSIPGKPDNWLRI